MRYGELVVVAWVIGALMSGPAAAAQQEPADDEDSEPLEEVLVTGSRVRRSNLDSPSPVIVFDAAQLKNVGITTMAEFSRYLPQNSNIQSDARLGSSLLHGSAGFNLRGIGLDGTLTLVNGRRIAPFASSGDLQPFVDINAIPVAAIDRIEVLTDGASAIYGSEAVAGVVNIITLQNIEGVTAEGGFLTTAEGDGDEWDANLTGGWSNEDTSVTGTLSWFDRDLIWSRDRDWSSSVNLSDRGGFSGGSSASSPPTIDLLETGRRLADPACPEDSPYARRAVFRPGVREQCMFNYAWFTTLQQPSQRLGLTSSLRHEFQGGTTFFAELLANRSKTESIMAPTPLFGFFVPTSHPDNIYGEDLLIRYRALDTGDRGFDTTATTWRLVAGVDGTWGAWEWEAALMGSKAETDDSRFNGVLNAEFQSALLGEGGPNGDQFYNPFGLNPQNPQEVIDQFTISGTHVIETTKEQTADFQVSGKFGNLPGGAVGAAFGGQFRHQSIGQVADEEELTAVIAGSDGLEPISANRDIFSVFTEFVLPLHRTLEAQLALRWDDYSDFGSTVNPKIGLGWRPVEDVLVRATWGTSFRPPTFRELFAPYVSYEGFIDKDPWRCPVTDDFFDCNGYEIISEFGGNPDLQPDEGQTWLFGIAWEPSQAPGLSISLDYWSIQHRNRIASVYDDLLSEFLLGALPPDTNPFVIRAPQTAEDLALGIPGVITRTIGTYINADKLSTDGIDFNLEYSWDTTHAGNFTGGVAYTYLNGYSAGVSFQEAQFERDFAGGYADDGPLPQNRGNLHLEWKRDSHGASALLNYAGHYQSYLNLVVDNQETDTPFIVDDYWQLDLQYSYVFDSLKGAMLRLGCRNCLDADPPVYNYDVVNEPFHEGRGVLLYIRWTQPFK